MLGQPEGELFAALRAGLATSWRRVARPEQIAPAGPWRVWLVMAGRGFGKTRTGAEWVQEQAMSGMVGRIALVAPTAADARDTMIEGESGILSIAPNHARPFYEPSKRRLTWPNGTIATSFSAEEPERLRGPQHGAAWGDELGAWTEAQSTWDQLMFGLRLGKDPRCLITTTPKPLKLIRDLLNRSDTDETCCRLPRADVVVTRGKTRDNAANLAPGFVEAIESRYGGTRLGRQELDGQYLEDVPGALWQRQWIDDRRVMGHPDLRRVVVAIDPAVSSGEKADETGIVAAGVAADGQVYVLADRSMRGGPLDWASRAVAVYREHRADRIVAEVNNGGELVKVTIRMVDPNVSFKAVHASRGKVVRAEPISALYEQGKVHHVGTFGDLEDQMCAFTTDFSRSQAGFSPDRVDALVWAITELAVQAQPAMPVFGSYSWGGGDEHKGIAGMPPPDWFKRGDIFAPGDPSWKKPIGQEWLARQEAKRPGFLESRPDLAALVIKEPAE